MLHSSDKRYQTCHPLTCFHFLPLSPSTSLHLSFSPLAVSLDNNNLPHRAHYSIKEGLRENTDHCVGSRALSFDSLSHPHEKEQLRKNKNRQKKKTQFRDFSLDGKFTPRLNVINISTKNSNASCANRNRQLFLMVVYDLLPFVPRNAALYSLLWLLSPPFREVNFILIIRRLSSVSELFEDIVSLGSDTNWRLTRCPNKGSKYSLLSPWIASVAHHCNFTLPTAQEKEMWRMWLTMIIYWVRSRVADRSRDKLTTWP